MNNKNVIIAGAIAIGLYILSRPKKIYAATAQKVAQRIRPPAPSTIRQRTAQKIAQKVAQKIAQKVAPKRIGQPTTWAAFIAARKAAAQKVAAQKAAIRKATAQKIGKKIGKTVAQKIPLNIKARRAMIAQYAKRQRPRIQRPRPNKKQIASRLFPGAEKSRIIPYSESSKHSYYGPKSHKLQNEGYRVEMNKRQANSIEAYDDSKLQYVSTHPEHWKR